MEEFFSAIKDYFFQLSHAESVFKHLCKILVSVFVDRVVQCDFVGTVRDWNIRIALQEISDFSKEKDEFFSCHNSASVSGLQKNYLSRAAWISIIRPVAYR